MIVSHDTDLIETVRTIVASNQKAVADYKSGKEKAFMSLFGQCMRELKGNCDPQTLKTILTEYIADI